MTPITENTETTEVAVHNSKISKKMEELANSRLGLCVLALISFVESALPVPLLTDPFLATAVLFNRANVVRIVLITTASSVLGGLAAYSMAYFAFEQLASHLSPTLLHEFNDLIENNDSNALALTLVGAITPIPYTVVAWVVGALSANPLVFIIGSVVGRGARYAIVGFCAYTFGPAALKYARKYILLSSGVAIILIGLLVFLK